MHLQHWRLLLLLLLRRRKKRGGTTLSSTCQQQQQIKQMHSKRTAARSAHEATDSTER
jgi:hypothetical protein